MTHRLTPREKPLEQVAYEGWAQGLPGCEWSNQTETQKRAWSKAASAILTALASGSGDHAELARLVESLRRGKVSQGDRSRVATLSEALLAENAALRAERDQIRSLHDRATDRSRHWEIASINADNRATEAERKLAEAVGLVERSIDLMTDEYADTKAYREEVRTFLNKEAERG